MLSLRDFKTRLAGDQNIPFAFVKKHLDISEDYALALFKDSNPSFDLSYIVEHENDSFASRGDYIIEKRVLNILGEKKYLRAIEASNDCLRLAGKFSLFGLLKKLVPLPKELQRWDAFDIMRGACEGNQITVVRFLRIRMKDKFFEINPLQIACECGSKTVFTYLLSFGSLLCKEDIDGALWSAIFTTNEKPNTKLITFICRHKRFINKKNITAIYKNIELWRFSNPFEIIKALLGTGFVDVNKNYFHITNYSVDTIVKCPLLAKAVDDGLIDLVELFLSQPNIIPNKILTATEYEPDYFGFGKNGQCGYLEYSHSISILSIAIDTYRRNGKTKNARKIIELILKHNKTNVSTTCRSLLIALMIKY